jgi:hypothetical protein
VTIADDLHRITLHALANCTESQRSMYMRVHGISEHGATNTESAAEIARELGITRQTAHDQLNAARLEVYRSIALDLIKREEQREQDEAMPVPGITTLDKNDARRTLVRYSVRTEQRVNLGPGSQAMERVEKHTPGASTDTMRVRTHQQYARGGNR